MREQRPIRLCFDISSAGLREQRFKKPENVCPLFRGDKKLDNRRPLAPGTGDSFGAETNKLTIGVKRNEKAIQAAKARISGTGS